MSSCQWFFGFYDQARAARHPGFGGECIPGLQQVEMLNNGASFDMCRGFEALIADMCSVWRQNSFAERGSQYRRLRAWGRPRLA